MDNISRNFYIADTHFGHENIIGFDHRPFSDANEMERVIVQNWNNVVSKKDVVYIIGDFCWKKEDEWLRLLDLLNGEKVLIAGNHDLKNPSSRLKRKFRKITEYQEITDNGKKIIMSHYPILFYKSSYNKDVWHFCGHTHNRTREEEKRQKFVETLISDCSQPGDNRGQIVNVGCMMDYMDYTPKTAQQLFDWWENKYKNIIPIKVSPDTFS